MNTLPQGTYTLGRALHEVSENCPPGYSRFDQQNTQNAVVVMASVSGALLLAVIASCVAGCMKGNGKKAIPLVCGFALASTGVILGAVTAIISLGLITNKDGECLPESPPTQDTMFDNNNVGNPLR